MNSTHITGQTATHIPQIRIIHTAIPIRTSFQVPVIPEVISATQIQVNSMNQVANGVKKPLNTIKYISIIEMMLFHKDIRHARYAILNFHFFRIEFPFAIFLNH